jgi:hypothetical protein
MQQKWKKRENRAEKSGKQIKGGSFLNWLYSLRRNSWLLDVLVIFLLL